MKFLCTLYLAIALLIACPLLITVADADESCCFGMKADEGGTSMRIQCDGGKPVDLENCKAKEITGERDKVFLSIVCCNESKDYCITTVIPTNKSKV